MGRCPQRSVCWALGLLVWGLAGWAEAATGQAVLTWLPGDPTLATHFERASVATGPYVEIANVPAGITTYTDTGLAVPSTPCYRARHIRPADNVASAYSAVVCGNLIAPPNAPSGVTITITITVP